MTPTHPAPACPHASAGESRFRAMFEYSALGVGIIDAATGVLVDVNPAFCRIIGYAPEELLGRVAGSLSPAEDGALTREPVRHLRAGRRDSVIVEKRFVRKDGHVIWGRLTISRVDGPAAGAETLIGMLEDISERKAMEAQLTRQAFQDPLTDLANRALFHDRVEHALTRTAGGRGDARGGRVAVLFIDLDGFKHVNDSLGHSVGDHLLTVVASRLEGCVRASDTVARLGGDEFAVLLEDAQDVDDARQVADRVLAALRAPVHLEGRSVVVGASVGIALASTGDDADALLRSGDAAMYAAKHDGKGRYAVYNPDMHRRALERLQLEADLRQAVARGELALHYQPLIDLRTGRVRGAEALLRWQHATLGAIPPAKFIPVAEETGLIVEIGRWVLHAACRQAAAWRAAEGADASADAAGGFTMSVNLSGRQLHDPALPSHVVEALEAAGLPPACLMLEITESVLMQRASTVTTQLAALKRLGVGLAIDDFGTGYSSLSHLQRFPVDVLKIDKSFVDGLVAGSPQAGVGRDTGKDAALVRTIVALGQALGLRVVAEGIEAGQQRDALTELGCDVGQGYFFARPMPPERFATTVADDAAARAA